MHIQKKKYFLVTNSDASVDDDSRYFCTQKGKRKKQYVAKQK